MIARLWRGQALAAKAADYEHHFTQTVVPELKTLAGHRGAYLLKRADGDEVEFLALTLWESFDAVRAFTGPDPEVAVVEPAAVAALSKFDSFARHFEVAFAPAAAKD